jgi:hypothetical protein
MERWAGAVGRSPDAHLSRAKGARRRWGTRIIASSLVQELAVAEFAEDLFDGPVEVVGAGDGEVGVGLRGQDVEFGHGAGGGFELGSHRFFRAPALAHVAVDAAVEADLVRSVDVDAEVVERNEIWIVQCEDAFDDDKPGRGDGIKGSQDARVMREVVDGPLDGVTVGQSAEMLDEEFALQRVGVVEVLLIARLWRDVRQVAVIKIQRKDRRFELRGEFACEGCFTRAGTTGNAEDNGSLRRTRMLLIRFG